MTGFEGKCSSQDVFQCCGTVPSPAILSSADGEHLDLAPPQACFTRGADLPIFEDVPFEYDPTKHWLDGGQPAHPLFDQHSFIQTIISEIKGDLLEHAFDGLRLAINESLIPIPADLVENLESNSDVFKAVLAAQNYGGIYLASRSDARRWTRVWRGQENIISLIRQVDNFLRTNHVGIKVLNFAVHAFVNDPKMNVDREKRLVPNNAICCKGKDYIAVKEKCFLLSRQELFGENVALYDLHDFAHLTAATLCFELYGNQYHPSLAALPQQLTALIRSPNLSLKKGRQAGMPLVSDGIIFSEFLTRLFNDEARAALAEVDAEGGPKMSYRQLTAHLATIVAEYLMGRRALIHNTTGESIALNKSITAIELAVLAQNKAYELTSSEIEQRVFFRGRVKEVEDRDELEALDAWERITWLANSCKWTYFEVRNTIKHRAQKEAYRMVAEESLARGEDQALCQKILDNILYEDWKRGHRVNLWDVVSNCDCGMDVN